MPIKLSNKLKKDIADVNSIKPEDIEGRLWAKSGKKCFLCDEDINIASDTIEVDHDIPTNEEGTSELSNLNLAHRHVCVLDLNKDSW